MGVCNRDEKKKQVVMAVPEICHWSIIQFHRCSRPRSSFPHFAFRYQNNTLAGRVMRNFFSPLSCKTSHHFLSLILGTVRSILYNWVVSLFSAIFILPFSSFLISLLCYECVCASGCIIAHKFCLWNGNFLLSAAVTIW